MIRNFLSFRLCFPCVQVRNFTVEGCLFDGNSALIGGGLALYEGNTYFTVAASNFTQVRRSYRALCGRSCECLRRFTTVFLFANRPARSAERRDLVGGRRLHQRGNVGLHLRGVSLRGRPRAQLRGRYGHLGSTTLLHHGVHVHGVSGLGSKRGACSLTRLPSPIPSTFAIVGMLWRVPSSTLSYLYTLSSLLFPIGPSHPLTLPRSQVHDGDGGAVAIRQLSRQFDVTNCLFSGNACQGNGGAIGFSFGTSAFVMRECIARGNWARDGVWSKKSPDLATPRLHCPRFHTSAPLWNHEEGPGQAEGKRRARESWE